MDGDVITISATEFKAKCLSLFDQLEGRKLSRVVVTRRGKPVAEMTAPKTEIQDIWGAHRGSVIIPPGVDLTQPAHDEPWDAERGILYNE
jgi:hypothetical protein